jgi:hypothetical protein
VEVDRLEEADRDDVVAVDEVGRQHVVRVGDERDVVDVLSLVRVAQTDRESRSWSVNESRRAAESRIAVGLHRRRLPCSSSVVPKPVSAPGPKPRIAKCALAVVVSVK